MKILFICDIVGRPGRNAVKAFLPGLKAELKLDLVFANGENLAGGLGLTIDKYREMIEAGIDYFTTGNHVWAKREFVPYLDDENVRVIRPANYPATDAGRGWTIIEKDGVKVQLINLIGKAFMRGTIEDYFDVADSILEKTEADIRIVDFHAETTSEKAILGFYLDGRVSAVLGTHTHVATADERLLPKGTAFQTDIGMTGPINSSLGAKVEPFLEALRTNGKADYKIASGPVLFSATLLSFDENNKVTAIERVRKIHEAL